MRRRLPPTFEDRIIAVAGGNGGERFALLVERSWVLDDRTELRRHAIVWAHVGNRALSATEIEYAGTSSSHRFATVDVHGHHRRFVTIP